MDVNRLPRLRQNPYPLYDAERIPIDLEDPLPPKWSGSGMLLNFPPGKPLPDSLKEGLRAILGSYQVGPEPVTNYHVMPSAMDVGPHEAGHQFHDRPTIRTIHDTDQAVQRAAQAECDPHVWCTSIRGGEPLTVSYCMGCRVVDWADLRKQVDAYARLYAARLLEEVYGSFEYPDGSRRIAWVDGRSQMVNVQQVYNLFTKEERDGCEQA